MTMIPGPLPPPPGPLFHREGTAQVNYEVGADAGTLQFHVEGWRRPVSCTERQWLELVAAVSAVMADPLVESRRVAARVAALGDRGGDRAA